MLRFFECRNQSRKAAQSGLPGCRLAQKTLCIAVQRTTEPRLWRNCPLRIHQSETVPRINQQGMQHYRERPAGRGANLTYFCRASHQLLKLLFKIEDQAWVRTHQRDCIKRFPMRTSAELKALWGALKGQSGAIQWRELDEACPQWHFKWHLPF